MTKAEKLQIVLDAVPTGNKGAIYNTIVKRVWGKADWGWDEVGKLLEELVEQGEVEMKETNLTRIHGVTFSVYKVRYRRVKTDGGH